MKKVLKWILIGLGIALLALFVAMVAFRGFAVGPSLMMGSRGLGFRHPFGGMMFGMGLFMLFRVLLAGTVLGLAVFGVIALFRGHKSVPVSAVASVTPVTPVTPEVQTAEVNVEPEKNCIKCSKPLQADWKNCPYCGKKQ
jgi:hypothetical protein